MRTAGCGCMFLWMLIVLLSSTLSGRADALQCYACTSQSGSDEKCADPFQSAETITQLGDQAGLECAQCVKTKAGDVIARVCLPSGSGYSNDCHEETQDGVTETMCLCDTDLCNTASRTGVTLTTSVTIGVLVLLAKHLL